MDMLTVWRLVLPQWVCTSDVQHYSFKCWCNDHDGKRPQKDFNEQSFPPLPSPPPVAQWWEADSETGGAHSRRARRGGRLTAPRSHLPVHRAAILFLQQFKNAHAGFLFFIFTVVQPFRDGPLDLDDSSYRFWFTVQIEFLLWKMQGMILAYNVIRKNKLMNTSEWIIGRRAGRCCREDAVV